MTGLDVTPQVLVDGVLVASSGRPAGLLALAGVRVRYGAQDLLARPEPSTAQLVLFSTAAGLSSQSYLDRRVELRAVAGGSSWPVFTGRVLSVEARPQVLDGVRGLVFVLECASVVLAELAGIVPTGGNETTPMWPLESSDARRLRLQSLIGAALPLGIQAWVPSQRYDAAAVPAGDDRTLADHLHEWAEMVPHTVLAITPAGQARLLPRRFWSLARGLVGLARDEVGGGGARAGLGAYAATFPMPVVESTDPAVARSRRLYLPDVEDPEGVLTQDIAARCTRVELHHPYSQDPFVRLVPGRSEAAGKRTAEARTIVDTRSFQSGLAFLADELVSVLLNELAGYRLPPLTWRSSVAGFPGLDAAQALLAGYAVPDVFWLEGAWWADHGVRPVVGLVGGVIEHDGEEWTCTLYPTPATTSSLQHPIAWDEIDRGLYAGESWATLRWRDAPAGDTLHDSVTWRDIGYVAQGLGVVEVDPAGRTNTVPEDYGHDSATPPPLF